MIISSEYTGKTYNTVKECLEDEEKFLKEKEQEELEKKKFKEEVEKAYQDAVDACERYFKLVGVNIDINDDTCIVTYNDLDDELFRKIYETMF